MRKDVTGRGPDRANPRWAVCPWLRFASAVFAALVVASPQAALAQHADDNIVTAAKDAFGMTKGIESIGIYDPSEVRGFDPQKAGNARIEGLYFDQRAYPGNRVFDGSVIRVGASAQGYSFPAPTGIVDYQLRDPGDKDGGTAVLYAGPFESRAFDVDGRLSGGAGRIRMPVGLSYRLDAPLPGYTMKMLEAGAAPQWKPKDDVVVRAFTNWRSLREEKAQPQIYVQGSFLPPNIPPRYFGQNWAAASGLETTSGIIVNSTLASTWHLDAGIFRSTFRDTSESYTDQIFETSPLGSADHVVTGYPRSHTGSTSGEIRLTRHFALQRSTHEVAFSARGRQVDSFYGGYQDVAVGSTEINPVTQVPKPFFVTSALTHDSDRLTAAGLAYHGSWKNSVELTVGAQRLNYEKTVTEPGLPTSRQDDQPWRIYSAFAISLSSRVLAYGGYTQGLEDSGMAPNNAVNRSAILPATRTWQRDAGVRVKLTSTVTAVAGVFEVQKPYFNLTPDRVFAVVGKQQRRGVEISVVGEITKGFTLVAGAVIADPLVSGAATGVGAHAVGQTGQRLQASVDYQWACWPALSTGMTVGHLGSRAAALDNSIDVPAYTTWDLNARYRLSTGRWPATLRVILQNALNDFSWEVAEDAAFTPHPGRSLMAYLTVDF